MAVKVSGIERERLHLVSHLLLHLEGVVDDNWLVDAPRHGGGAAARLTLGYGSYALAARGNRGHGRHSLQKEGR